MNARKITLILSIVALILAVLLVVAILRGNMHKNQGDVYEGLTAQEQEELLKRLQADTSSVGSVPPASGDNNELDTSASEEDNVKRSLTKDQYRELIEKTTAK